MPWFSRTAVLAALAVASVSAAPDTRPATPDARPVAPGTRPAGRLLFPEKGVPKGWSARLWSDVSEPAPNGASWAVGDDGVLRSDGRGSWLVSDAEFGDFVLAFEFKLGERGNSGCGIRFPAAGDPAFDGIEIQMADARYNDNRDTPDKLTGAVYKAVAPREQAYKPTEWNRYVIAARGPRLTVELNGTTVQNLNLDDQRAEVRRHDDAPAPPLKDRPRRGRIGFQDLSRGGTPVLIRDVRITVLGEGEPTNR